MPLRIPPEELEAIFNAVTQSPSGLSVSDLLDRSSHEISRRTLQRRLQLLVEQERLVAIGEGRARRYLVATSTTSQPKSQKPSITPGSWLGPEAEHIRELVRRPLSDRSPVGYQPAFLANYEPNVTTYLPKQTRRELAEVGQVGITDLPAGTYLRQVMNRLLIDLSWNSSRLEGNTYSFLETRRLIEHGESAEGKAAEESQMILNHKAAIEMLADQAEEVGFNRYTICNLHALLADNLLADPGAGGRLRIRPVGITGTVYHPLEIPQQIDERFEEILAKAGEIDDPFEQAFFCLVQLPYLQPFEDVNKRVSRLAANIPLVRENLCPLSFIEVPTEDYLSGLIGIYELNRVDYLRDLFVWAYKRSAAQYSALRQSLGDPDPFRLRYRAKIGVLVREIVQERMDRTQAVRRIITEAEKGIDAVDRPRFIDVVEIELDSLHSGNIARYRLRPSEFETWRGSW